MALVKRFPIRMRFRSFGLRLPTGFIKELNTKAEYLTKNIEKLKHYESLGYNVEFMNVAALRRRSEKRILPKTIATIGAIIKKEVEEKIKTEAIRVGLVTKQGSSIMGRDLERVMRERLPQETLLGAATRLGLVSITEETRRMDTI